MNTMQLSSVWQVKMRLTNTITITLTQQEIDAGDMLLKIRRKKRTKYCEDNMISLMKKIKTHKVYIMKTTHKLLLNHFLCHYINKHLWISWCLLQLCFIYVITICSSSAAYHRYYVHNSFKTWKCFEWQIF